MSTRRTSLVLAATALGCAAGVSTAAADLGPISGSGTIRIDGADRYAVSSAVAGAIVRPPQESVVIASGEVYPDALAAGPFAYAERAPILLVRRDSVPDTVLARLLELAPTRIVAVGGPATIADSVLDEVEAATGASVERIAGADRYDVAAALARAHSAGGADTAYVVSGLVFSDALSAGPAAIRDRAPVLLTRDTTLPDVTAAELARLAPRKVVVVGGSATVSSAVTAAIKGAVPGVDVDRYDGADRYAVAANLAMTKWGDSASAFYASGVKFPDALSGTPAAGANAAPILLTRESCRPYETTKAREELGPGLDVLLGGALSAYGGSTTCGPEPAYPFPDDLDCKDFASQDQAQSWFDYWEPRVGDIYYLDRDDDGKVCEIWPPG